MVTREYFQSSRPPCANRGRCEAALPGHSSVMRRLGGLISALVAENCLDNAENSADNLRTKCG